ncbi:MAG: glucan 1,4-alpha-glucosidase [Planctomycetota bacterium]|nr:MAG: glucan 1,4-alpha-glucosidase [Planctomycetota bacterium]
MPSSPRHAFGAPGIEPRWTRSDKSAVGTAYFAGSRLWFTLAAGIVSELYYPTLDRPQTRDLQYMISDGKSFFHDERRDTTCHLEQLSEHSLGFRLTNSNEEYGYRIVKEIITDPHYACLLVHTRLEGDESLLETLNLYALLAPHLGGGGRGNSACVDTVAGREVMLAHKDGVWLALGASAPLLRRSCGYVGTSDGWTDLANNFQMDWEFDAADNGNVALTAQIDLSRGFEFTLGVALGDTRHHAQTNLLQSLETPFATHRERFIEQWQRTCGHVTPLARHGSDDGCLYRRSHSLLLAHEDKSFPGALIASLSIPWGESKGDEDLGGYHLVWPRDMVHSSTALLATGNTATPYRSLVYLACTQNPDGGFGQNFWINGDPYWHGVQLDEVSFAILLAWRVKQAGALRDFDPYPMVLRAAGYLVRQGPATPQERWEENSGYSPSSLAANIAALAVAALLADERGDCDAAEYLWQYADFLEANLDRWTVTTSSTLVPGISRHYIRILPSDVGNPEPLEDPNQAVVVIKNQAPGSQYEFPARDIVDGGFLELVRYGIRRAGDPLLEDTLHVVDQLLKVDTPFGPCWRRYNHDGYGQRDDGGPFDGWGRGRGWPLLTGERGHYELAAGRDACPYLRAMEQFSEGGLLAEQVWDAPDKPEVRQWLGRPTGSAMPLVWAHAEYLTLLRSVNDGQVYDLIPQVADRYPSGRKRAPIEFWKPNRHARQVPAGGTLRVQAPTPFVLRWTDDEWQTVHDTHAHHTPLGISFVDLMIARDQRAPIRFTFRWTEGDRWEGHDYAVTVVESAS